MISVLTTLLMLLLLAYGVVGAFAVEGDPAVAPAATPAAEPLVIDEAAFVQDVLSDANAYWAGEFARRGYS